MPAVFLDRDGTLNLDDGYTFRYEDFHWLPGAIESLKLLDGAGFSLIIVTNQAGIAKGLYKCEDVEILHKKVSNDLSKEGIFIKGYYYCPHHPSFTGPCTCRKPEPGLILRGAKEHGIDLLRSYMIGDKISDLEAGLNAKVNTILVRTGYGAGILEVPQNVRVAENVLEAAHIILEDQKRENL